MFIIKLGDNDMAKNTKGFLIGRPYCHGEEFFGLDQYKAVIDILSKYQIVQTLDKISNGTIHIAEGTMYPILYRLLDEGLISDEKRLVGKRQTRIYYHIEEKGIVHMQKLYEEYLTMINSIERIMENKYESE